METKFKIIELSEYFLAVSDEDASNSYIYFTGDPTGIFRTGIKYKNEAGDYFYQDAITGMSDTYLAEISKKIIGYQPKGNAPELDLPLLPEEECCEGDGSNCNGSCCIVENDVGKLFIEKSNIPYFPSELKETCNWWFREGHKAATKVYSEDDLVEFCMNMLSQYTQGNTNIHNRELLKESLTCKQSKPKWFVAEIIDTNSYNSEVLTGSYDSGNFQLKTTTINNKIYLEGTYLN
jgi:hypothetical protein